MVAPWPPRLFAYFYPFGVLTSVHRTKASKMIAPAIRFENYIIRIVF
jgi:hypothetical protein